MLNVSEGSSDTTILGSSLTPLQEYQVKVRSLVKPGDGSLYEGIPSEWTNPQTWTSKEGVYSINTPSVRVTFNLISLRKHHNVILMTTAVANSLVPPVYSGFCLLTASWSFTTLAYIVISVIVAAAFLALYCSIPACQRYFVHPYVLASSQKNI